MSPNSVQVLVGPITAGLSVIIHNDRQTDADRLTGVMAL